MRDKVKKLDDSVFELISVRIAAECEQQGISGVFGILQTPYPSQTRYTRVPKDCSFHDAEGRMYNCLAMTIDKLTRVFADRTVGRARMRYYGDSLYKGKDGHRSQDGKFIYAFSGGTEEVNDQIARLAEQFHKSLK